MFGGGPGGFMRREQMMDKLKEPKPKNIKEVPGYLKRLISKFFYRLFYIFGLVWEAKPWIMFVMVFNAIYNGVMPVISAFVGARVLNCLADAFTNSGDEQIWSRIIGLLVLQFGIIFINQIEGTLYNIVTQISGELVSNSIKIKIINKARTIDLQSFDRPEFYEKLENASREAGMRPIGILNATFNLFSTLISMISFIVVLASVAWWAPVMIVILSIPSAIISFVYRRKNFYYMRHRSKDRRQMQYYNDLMTNKDVVKEIRVFNLSDTFINRYKETFEKYFAGIKKIVYQENGWHILISIVRSATSCGLFLYIARRVWKGLSPIGDYSLYTGALNSISGGVSSIINTTTTIYEGTLFIDNMIAFMNEEQTIVPSLPEPLHVKRHCGHVVEFKNVSFKYPGTDRFVLKNINLTLNKGETCVLVGLNGAGKTTLIKLLTRLYDPTEGVILLDGEDIKKYDVSELYDMFGIIFQDFGKYAVSVSENIMFGQINKGIVDEDIREAAHHANSDDFIERLPNQYNTSLMKYFDADGIELSIGQWQKLSIARAFYSDSDFLILDEPTASLDAIAEQEIYNQFDELRKDKTTIFVSHRLSSATTASKIVVLEYGELVEEGNHSQLMNKKGKYYELFSTQAKRYMTEIDENDVLEDTPSFGPENGKPPFANGSFPPPPPGDRPVPGGIPPKQDNK